MAGKRYAELLKEIDNWEKGFVAKGFLTEWPVSILLRCLPKSYSRKLAASLEAGMGLSHDFMNQTGKLSHMRELLEEKKEPLNSPGEYFQLAKDTARQYINASTLQGSLAAAGSRVFSLADIPVTLAFEIEMLQALAFCFGYDTRLPSESLLSLELLNSLYLSTGDRRSAWKHLNKKITEYQDPYFFNQKQTVKAGLHVMIRQSLKLWVLVWAGKKLKPLGVVAGGLIARRRFEMTAEAACYFYLKRFLIEEGVYQ